jgi:hypothetical protein
MGQLSYNEQAIGFAGLLNSAEGAPRLIEAGVLGGAVNVPFGTFVVASAGLTSGTGTGTNPLSTEGTGAVFIQPSAASSANGWRAGGIVLQSHEYDKRLDLDANGSVITTRQLNVLKKGRVFVSATTAMGLNDDVYARYTANGALAVGTIGNTSDSSKAQKLWGARVITPILAAGICEIEIDMGAFVVGDQAP